MWGMATKDRPLYLVIVEDRGRVVLPAELRRRAGLERGERLAVQAQEDGSFRLERLTDRLDRLTGSQAHLGPGLVDELLADRQLEARRETDDERPQPRRVAARRSSRATVKSRADKGAAKRAVSPSSGAASASKRSRG
jgi:AbrB family looped-hinge helix DNA binding protein